MDLRKFKDYNERRNFLEKQAGVPLQSIGETFNEDLDIVHCENLIGAVSIPLGVAGPIMIQGDHVKRNALIPLATTEGALVASVNRGCKAISQGGGAVVLVEDIGTTRGPVFRTQGIREGKELCSWVKRHFEALQKIASSTSSHISLLKSDSQINGTEVYMRFYYNTDDAMGMNMVTIATEKITQFIEKNCDAACIAVAGNFDIDKKPAWLNSICGRGKKGWAEVTLSSDIVQNVLKTTPEKMVDVVRSKCWGGSIMAGALGFNAHFANIVAAFFAATGQDLAHVVEGSMGVTSARQLDSGDLYFAISMPALMLGTVGGGTKLKTQTEARNLTNAKTALELGEILLAGVLAGELSLIASISEQSLARAHVSLGR